MTSTESIVTTQARALPPLAGGGPSEVAGFSYDVGTDSWWWSPAMYALHGLAEDVEPTTEVLLAHKHPADRPQAERTLHAALETGEPFCCRHRIVDAGGTVHNVISVGEGTVNERGAVVAVRGYFIDVDESLRELAAKEAAQAVARSAESRAAIEQAKGILIVAFQLNPDSAFELLVWASQRMNVKVRELANGLVDQFADSASAHLPTARRAGDYLGLLDD